MQVSTHVHIALAHIAQSLCIPLQRVQHAYCDCRFPSIAPDLPVEGFRAALRDDLLAQLYAKRNEYRALGDEEEAIVPEGDAIHAWRNDTEAQARLLAEVAQALGVHMVYVTRAYRHGLVYVGLDATRLVDYIAHARAALIDEVRVMRFEDDERERAYQARRREELKAKRARPTPPTRVQPGRSRAALL